MPGPPFVFGAMLVILAILVAAFIPDNPAPGLFDSAGDRLRRRIRDEEKRRQENH